MNDTQNTESAPAPDAVVQPVVAQPQAAVDAQAAADEADARPEGTGAGASPAAQAAKSDAPDPLVLVANATAALDELKPQVTAAAKEMEDAKRRYDALIAERDKHIVVVEAHKEKLTHADSVKRIQAQTVANLQRTKEQTSIAATALKAAGISVYPSKLDEAMAMRRKGPEQAARHASFIHQGQREALAARTGG